MDNSDQKIAGALDMESSLDGDGMCNINNRDQLSNRTKRLCLISAIVVFSLLPMLPIIIKGLPSGDDTFVHYRWITHYSNALREGVLYPRWLAESNFGYGSPAPNYYPPLSTYSTAMISLITGSASSGMIISCWLAMFLSGFAMYILCIGHLDWKLSALAAVLYMLAPYHIFDLYQRFAFSEYWALVWIPLLFDSLRRLIVRPHPKHVVYVAACYGLLLLTNLPMTLAVSLIIPFYILILTRKFKQLVLTVAGLIMGFGLSGIYTIPMLFERDYIRINSLLTYQYVHYFIFEHLSHLFSIPLFSLTERWYFFIYDADKIALALTLVLLLSVIICLMRSTSQSRETRTYLVSLSFIAMISLLMASRISAPLWKGLHHLPYLQFPVRWLGITTVVCIVAVVFAYSFVIHNPGHRILLLSLLTLFVAINLALSLTAMVRSSHDFKQISEGIDWKEVPEYRPVWWDKHRHTDMDPVPAIVLSGDAVVVPSDEVGIYRTYQVEARTDSEIAFKPLFFPGWTARIDGMMTPVKPSFEGHIEVSFPSGTHTLTLRLEDTTPRIIGKWMSIITLITLAFILFGWERIYPRARGRNRLAG